MFCCDQKSNKKSAPVKFSQASVSLRVQLDTLTRTRRYKSSFSRSNKRPNRSENSRRNWKQTNKKRNGFVVRHTNDQPNEQDETRKWIPDILERRNTWICSTFSTKNNKVFSFDHMVFVSFINYCYYNYWNRISFDRWWFRVHTKNWNFTIWETKIRLLELSKSYILWARDKRIFASLKKDFSSLDFFESYFCSIFVWRIIKFQICVWYWWYSKDERGRQKKKKYFHRKSHFNGDWRSNETARRTHSKMKIRIIFDLLQSLDLILCVEFYFSLTHFGR